MPTLMNLAEQRWHQATSLLYDLLQALPRRETITKQHLLRGEQHGKKIRTELKDSHEITGKELKTLLRNLEAKGRISFETAKRGQCKIIIN